MKYIWQPILLISVFVFPTLVSAQIRVYEDEYVFREIEKQENDQIPEASKLAALTNKFNIVKGGEEKLKLALPKIPGQQTRVLRSKKVVTYTRSKDRCLTNPIPGYLCSPNYYVSIDLDTDDPFYARDQLWGLNGEFGIDAPRAWDYTTGGDVHVAVLDTGVNLSHIDLKNNIWRNTREVIGNNRDDDNNGYVDDVWGVNVINGGSPNDDNGHGSHVSGTICAEGENERGVAGVTWSCKIIPIKFLNSSGGGSLFDAVKGIDYVIALKNRGVPVVLLHNSWGGGASSPVLENAIVRAKNAGLLFVASAGNRGRNIDIAPTYPAAYPQDNIISVAAITKQGKLASFSNFGSRGVDIAAPGVDIFSTYKNGNEYVALSGTSMAAPHVSGAIALLKSREQGLNWSQLKARTLSQGRPLNSLRGKVKTERTLNAYLMFRPDVNPTPKPKCRKKRNKRCLKKCKEKFPNKRRKRRRCRDSCREKFNCSLNWWESFLEMFE